MYPELNGKHALITGGSRGFGRAIALRLAREGVAVAVNYRRSKSDAEDVVKQIEKNGGRAFAVRGDVGKEENIARMFDEVRENFGRLDIVIANAAWGVPGKLIAVSYTHLTLPTN